MFPRRLRGKKDSEQPAAVPGTAEGESSLVENRRLSRLRTAVPPSPSVDMETASTGSGGGGGQRDRRGSGATSRSSSPPTESEERYDVDSESENAKVCWHQHSIDRHFLTIFRKKYSMR